MHIKHLISAAAIAMVAGFGTAAADEKFTTLHGFQPAAIPADELGAIHGAEGLQTRTTVPLIAYSGAGDPPPLPLGIAGLVRASDNAPAIQIIVPLH